MTHSRSLFSLWLIVIFVLLPILSVEILDGFSLSFSFLFALPAGAALLGLFFLLFRLHTPQKTLLDTSRELLGNKTTAVISFFYLLFFLLLCTLLIETFGARTVHSLMFHSDARFYNMTLLFLSAVIASSGLKTIGRMAEILAPVFAVFFLFLFFSSFLSAPTVDFSVPPSDLIRQVPVKSGAFAILFACGMIPFLLEKELKLQPHSKKQCVCTAVFAALYALFVPLLTVFILGRFLTEETTSSVFSALRQFRLFDRFGNMHLFLFIPWLLCTLPVCSLFLWAISALLRQLFSTLSVRLQKIASPLLVLVILAIRNELNSCFSQTFWYALFLPGILLLYGFPLLIFLLRQKTKPHL